MLGIALESLRQLEPDFVSVTYGAGRLDARPDGRADQVDQAGARDRGDGPPDAASAPLATSCDAILDDIAEAGIDNVLALRGDPPRGETDLEPHPEGLSLLDRAGRPDRRRLRRSASAPPAFRRSTSRRRTWLSDLEHLKHKVDARRLVPDHAAVLRQRAVLPVRRRGARGRDRGADPARDHADHRPAPDQDDHRHVRRDDPRRRCARRSSGARTTPTPCCSSASPTRRCSAPSCWPAVRPGIHFYTLNRSPATRAILSALRLLRPWVRREVVNQGVA